MPFNFKKLEIPEVILIQPQAFIDQRGFFMETYKITDFTQFGIKEEFVQDNHSFSASKGVLRGLHYQKEPKAQAKLVRVIVGSIFDVALDLRKNSPNYGKWVSAILSSKNKAMLYIPEGFAHGYCILEDDTEVLYKCSQVYSSLHERGIAWNDVDINIKWPIENPVLSSKDSNYPKLKEADNDFIYE